MTKWKCNDCKAQFYDPDTALYRAGRIGNGSENWEEDEYIDMCPSCGSIEIYEGVFCDECEKEVSSEKELVDGQLCADCLRADEEFDKMVERCNEFVRQPQIDLETITKQILTKPKGE